MDMDLYSQKETKENDRFYTKTVNNFITIYSSGSVPLKITDR